MFIIVGIVIIVVTVIVLVVVIMVVVLTTMVVVVIVCNKLNRIRKADKVLSQQACRTVEHTLHRPAGPPGAHHAGCD